MDDPVKRIDRATNALSDSPHPPIDVTARHSHNPSSVLREIGALHAPTSFLVTNSGDGKAANLDLPIPHRYSA